MACHIDKHLLIHLFTVAPLKRTCNYNGNTYGVGEKFVSDEDGKYKCKTCICDEVDDGVFGVTCAQMCTADKIKCKDNEDMKYQTKSLGTDGMCGCLVPFCEARVKKQDTKHKGNTYYIENQKHFCNQSNNMKRPQVAFW